MINSELGWSICSGERWSGSRLLHIKLARLKKAAELLSDGNYRINEISYLVGFSSPSYFATSFQKQFGISPSQFIRKLK